MVSEDINRNSVICYPGTLAEEGLLEKVCHRYYWVNKTLICFRIQSHRANGEKSPVVMTPTVFAKFEYCFIAIVRSVV